jgi:hypothetical protein
VTSRRLIQLVRRYPMLTKLDLRIENPDILEAGNQVQTHLLEELEPIEERGTLTFVADQAVYVSTGEEDDPLPWLPKAKRIIEPITYVDTGGIITESSEAYEEVRHGRNRFHEHTHKTARPTVYYQVRTIPLSVAFSGTPTSTLQVSVRYVRQHTTADNLVDSEDGPHPLVPFERAMVLGCVAFLLEDRMDEFPKQAQASRQLFDAELNRLQSSHGRFPAERRFSPHELINGIY